MRQFVPLYVAVVIIATTSIAAADSTPPRSDIALDVRPGWSLVGDTTAFPVQFVHQDGDAEFLIFRTELAKDESVSGSAELKVAVQRIIDSVILPLPHAELISSTGYDETERVQFALEFRSASPGDGLSLQHRLVGYLYRATDSHQILFTLWGRGIASRFSLRHDDILAMQNSFKFQGEHEAVVFGTSSRKWPAIILMVLVAVSVGMYTRRLKSRAERTEPLRGRWTCECGHRNLPTLGQCAACGKARSMSVGVN